MGFEQDLCVTKSFFLFSHLVQGIVSPETLSGETIPYMNGERPNSKIAQIASNFNPTTLLSTLLLFGTLTLTPFLKLIVNKRKASCPN